MKFSTVLIVILVYLYLTGQLTDVINNITKIFNPVQNKPVNIIYPKVKNQHTINN